MRSKNEKFKLLAVSDLHGDSDLAEKLAVKAQKEKVNLVVLCGDVLGWVDSKNIIAPFKKRNKQVLIVPGNWDGFSNVDFLAAYYGIRNLHGSAAVYYGIGFFGAGGAEDSPGPGRIAGREIFDLLSRAYSGLINVEKKIMVTHMHPAGSKSEFSGVQGSKFIRKAIAQFKPDILLHGHIHEGSGLEEEIYETKVINVGRNGTIVVI